MDGCDDVARFRGCGRTGAARVVRPARILLARLASTPANRIDWVSRHQRQDRLSGMVRRDGLRHRVDSRGGRPGAAAVGVIIPLPVLHADWIQIAGIALAVLGIVLTVWAQLDMGDSWRVGVDESETTALVHTGMFGRMRNPIYTAMLTFDLGIALLTPNLVTIAGIDLRRRRSRATGAPSRGTVPAGQTR